MYDELASSEWGQSIGKWTRSQYSSFILIDCFVADYVLFFSNRTTEKDRLLNNAWKIDKWKTTTSDWIRQISYTWDVVEGERSLDIFVSAKRLQGYERTCITEISSVLFFCHEAVREWDKKCGLSSYYVRRVHRQWIREDASVSRSGGITPFVPCGSFLSSTGLSSICSCATLKCIHRC